MSAHDRYLANYRSHEIDVWCENRECANHAGTQVTYVSEYGQGWYEPEECWLCKHEWLADAPDEEEGEDDE
jgi:hypothetical protein